MARVLVAGAGALGSVFGGFLRLAGHEVVLLGRAAHMDAVRRDGLRIDGIWGAHHVTGLVSVTDLDAIQGRFDAILITVKSFDTETAAQAVAARVEPDGVFISLQNGLGNAEAIHRGTGSRRVLGCRVIFGARLEAPACVRVTVYADPVLVGVPLAADDAELTDLAQHWAQRFAAAGIPAQYCVDVIAALWGKVFYNAALNPLGALLGVHYGALAENVETRAVMDQVIDEAFAVAVAEGVSLPWPLATAYREIFYERLVPSTYDHRSSMLQDIERGRPTEIEAINGEVWRRGARHGMLTPANELLTRLLRAHQGMRGRKHG